MRTPALWLEKTPSQRRATLKSLQSFGLFQSFHQVKIRQVADVRVGVVAAVGSDVVRLDKEDASPVGGNKFLPGLLLARNGVEAVQLQWNAILECANHEASGLNALRVNEGRNHDFPGLGRATVVGVKGYGVSIACIQAEGVRETTDLDAFWSDSF